MKKRTAIVVGNWKMNVTIKEAIRLVTELKGMLSGKQEVEVVVAPDYISLHPVCIALQDVKIGVAAQNMFWEDSGAYTGEVSAAMLLDVGCSYVILGHSERRQHFGETDQQVRTKLKSALDQDLVPIICVGETLQQRQKNQTADVVERQLSEIFQGVNYISGDDFIVAYEPIWAIGTGNTASPEQAQEMHGLIRKKLAHIFRSDVAEQVRVIYGGSVTPENAGPLMKMPDVDGLLVGGASLEPKDFVRIVFHNEQEESE